MRDKEGPHLPRPGLPFTLGLKLYVGANSRTHTATQQVWFAESSQPRFGLIPANPLADRARWPAASAYAAVRVGASCADANWTPTLKHGRPTISLCGSAPG